MNPVVRGELLWWSSTLQSVSSYPFNPRNSGKVVLFTTAGDASDVGFFTYKVDSLLKLSMRLFTLVERSESLTFRELLALS